MNEPVCPLCNALDCVPFARHNRVEQDIAACRACGFYFVWPHAPYIHGVEDGHAGDEFWGSPEAGRAYALWREKINDFMADFISGQGAIGKVLEIGFGDGPLTEKIKPQADEYWGIEPIPAWHERTGKRLNLDPSRSLCMTAEEMAKKPPLSDMRDYFDTIIMISVFEHLSMPGDILRQCHRMLKPGGKLILSTPDSTHFKWHYRLRKLIRMDVWSHFHISFFSEKNLKNALQNAGFSPGTPTRCPLVSDESIRYFRIYNGSRITTLGMKALKTTGMDQALRLWTLLYSASKT